MAPPPIIASIFPREVEETCPREVRLREKQWVQGYWIAALTPLEFYPNGQIQSGYLAGPVTISGIPLEYGDYFLVNPEGELLSFRPSTPRTLFGQGIAARQLVHFETSAGTLQIKGKIQA